MIFASRNRQPYAHRHRHRHRPLASRRSTAAANLVAAANATMRVVIVSSPVVIIVARGWKPPPKVRVPRGGHWIRVRVLVRMDGCTGYGCMAWYNTYYRTYYLYLGSLVRVAGGVRLPDERHYFFFGEGFGVIQFANISHVSLKKTHEKRHLPRIPRIHLEHNTIFFSHR